MKPLLNTEALKSFNPTNDSEPLCNNCIHASPRNILHGIVRCNIWNSSFFVNSWCEYHDL